MWNTLFYEFIFYGIFSFFSLQGELELNTENSFSLSHELHVDGQRLEVWRKTKVNTLWVFMCSAISCHHRAS